MIGLGYFVVGLFVFFFALGALVALGGNPDRSGGITSGTRFFLVLLRLVIGWHFLFEGIDKLQSYQRGPAEGKTVWSSETYLKEASGPFADIFRNMTGDADAAALQLLTLPPLDKNQTPMLPPPLEKAWKDRFDRFVAFYGVGDEQAVQPEFVGALAVVQGGGPFAGNPWASWVQISRREGPDKLQRLMAQADFDHARDAALRWLQGGERQASRSFSQVNEKVPETTQQRLDAYRSRLQQVREAETKANPAFGSDVYKKKLKELKDEARKYRTELLADLDGILNQTLDGISKTRLTATQRAKGPLPALAAEIGRVQDINKVTMYGITAVGVCLLLGFLTRTACVAGAGFLLMFYLAMPALPWLPANPRAEGHYLFVNKNIIEMVALLALATTRSGRWCGLDGLLQFLRPSTWKSRV